MPSQLNVSPDVLCVQVAQLLKFDDHCPLVSVIVAHALDWQSKPTASNANRKNIELRFFMCPPFELAFVLNVSSFAIHDDTSCDIQS
jgi:hypothetical protein